MTAWLVYSVYAGAEAPRIRVGFGLVVVVWVALIVRPWFVAPGKGPAAWRVVVAFSVATLVPEGTLFLLGDNRENSHDSRHMGPVPNEFKPPRTTAS